MTEGYCPRCRHNVEMKDEKNFTMSNGRKAKQGICPDCGSRVFRIVKSKGGFF